LERCLEAIRDIRPTEDFERVAAGFRRIKNILDQANFAPTGDVDEGLIEDGAERDLYNDFDRIVYCDEPSENLDFRESLAQFAALRPAIDNYFDKVMVNAKDERVRANRLTMLHRLFHEFSTIADFSEIVTSGDQK
jgi:glycyl-tRNA synthetase beta chain